MNEDTITVKTTVDAPIKTVWECWIHPKHITRWAFGSDDWEAPEAENDLREGGTFKTVMAAKDGSASFDFTGTYTLVIDQKAIEYELDDGRQVRTIFKEMPDGVRITQTFDPENENSIDMQRTGWQTILDNFKQHTEAHLD
ncbi:MAG: Activator of Hsp90 ATPase 1 family protein [Candidatus Saccharibacteria bacterium]|nr:Activator of Hsp90 ATPase 1 family protein [Candidatus Saccharibacteria bacterium]